MLGGPLRFPSQPACPSPSTHTCTLPWRLALSSDSCLSQRCPEGQGPPPGQPVTAEITASQPTPQGHKLCSAIPTSELPRVRLRKTNLLLPPDSARLLPALFCCPRCYRLPLRKSLSKGGMTGSFHLLQRGGETTPGRHLKNRAAPQGCWRPQDLTHGRGDPWSPLPAEPGSWSLAFRKW